MNGMARGSDEVTKPTMLRYFLERTMNAVERLGNRLPDPAALFVVLLLVVWISSAVLATGHFSDVDPRTNQPITINNLLTGPALANFLATMVPTFLAFPPLGLVLVAMLGVGVAERSGFIAAALKVLLHVTSKKLLTPVVILAGVLSHTAGDVGLLLVIHSRVPSFKLLAVIPSRSYTGRDLEQCPCILIVNATEPCNSHYGH